LLFCLHRSGNIYTKIPVAIPLWISCSTGGSLSNLWQRWQRLGDVPYHSQQDAIVHAVCSIDISWRYFSSLSQFLGSKVLENATNAENAILTSAISENFPFDLQVINWEYMDSLHCCICFVAHLLHISLTQQFAAQ
jgi:hypothetical protein